LFAPPLLLHTDTARERRERETMANSTRCVALFLLVGVAAPAVLAVTDGKSSKLA
jgi:hypothetical protein